MATKRTIWRPKEEHVDKKNKMVTRRTIWRPNEEHSDK